MPTVAEWLARLDKVGQREGFFRHLGADHAALLGPTTITVHNNGEMFGKVFGIYFF